jgi:hypothetical protein
MEDDTRRRLEELRMEADRRRSRLDEAERTLANLLTRVEQIRDQTGADTELKP